MPKKVTTDHGEIIHFAGHRHLFPVAQRANRAQVRLAGKSDVSPDEDRIGWGEYFRVFLDGKLVFLYDEEGGQAVTREKAAELAAAVEARPSGATT